MPKELFIPRAFNASTRKIIRQANVILDEYRARGFVLTLRQLYYQFVARGIVPNRQSEYKRLGSIINDARLAGQIDWSMIEDRTRGLEKLPDWDGPEDIIQACANQFRLDLWAEQPARVEVWIEKEALVGVIEPVCIEYRVPYFACRGYASQSEQWRAGKRLANYFRTGHRVVILHLGDHDPSGIDMTRDNDDRLSMFARSPHVELKRVALNMDQVEQYRPPSNPAKTEDSRFHGYVERFGDESWELDALNPEIIDQLIRDEIEPLRDLDAWIDVLRREEETIRMMTDIAKRWPEVTEFIDRPDYA